MWCQALVQVLDGLDVPVVAAGGIGTAEAVRAALDGGADAVRVGTPWSVAVAQSDVPRGTLIASTGADTVITEAFSVGWRGHRAAGCRCCRGRSHDGRPGRRDARRGTGHGRPSPGSRPAANHGRHRRDPHRRPGRRGRPPPPARWAEIVAEAHGRPLTWTGCGSS